MSIKPRDMRLLAFQALYQLDAADNAPVEEALEAVRAAIAASAEDLSIPARDVDLDKALATAREAFAGRHAADREIVALAPEWPTQRQPAVDRAILRLAHHEMTRPGANPKIAVNEAVELAKRFSTDRSPAFVNGVLDKVLKRVLAEATPASPDAAPESPEPTIAPPTTP